MGALRKELFTTFLGIPTISGSIPTIDRFLDLIELAQPDQLEDTARVVDLPVPVPRDCFSAL